MQDLGTLPGATSSVAAGINNNGQIVGHSTFSPFTPENPTSVFRTDAFLYSGGAMQDIAFGGVNSFAEGINNGGQVVGYGNVNTYFDPVMNAFVGSQSNYQDIGTFRGNGSYSEVNGINDSGQVVGRADIIAGGNTHAILYNNGIWNDLGTLPGGSQSYGLAISNSGQVVGYGDTNGGSATHAFLWQGGSGMQDLGTLGGTFDDSVALGINNNGLIVGYDTISSTGSQDAFLYSDGVMQDLNDLIPSTSDWTLEEATGINDSGQIVGEGVNPSGQTDAFLLTPTPEPSTLALLAAGAIGLVGYGHWQRRQKRALALAGSEALFGADGSTPERNGPAVLPFASPRACSTKRARRAA